MAAQTACHHGPVADRPDSDREVLTSLPRTRPVRRSAKRAERPRTAAAATKSKPKATSTSAAAADGPKARKPAAKPRAAAQPKTNARAATGPRSADGARATSQRTRPASRQTVPPAGYASPPMPGEDGRSASADLLGTAVQAAGELAQIGFAVGRQALQSMLDRLPKP
jgi:hypothetical protein